MIKITYTKAGKLNVVQDKTAYFLQESFITDYGDTVPESNITGKPALVQAVFNAMKAIPTTGKYRMISFDSNTATIKVDGQVLTPDSDVSGFNQEVQTFFNAIYAVRTGPIESQSPAVRLYRAKQILQNGGASNG